MKNLVGAALLTFGLVVSNAQADTHTVEIQGFTFVPAHLVVNAGDTIEFVNRSRGVHTVTADKTLAKNPNNVVLPEGAEAFHSGAVKPNEVFAHDFAVAGEYRYICLPHETHGMAGTVTVLAPIAE